MSRYRILGIVLAVVGVALLGFAFNAANAPLEEVSNALTGRFTGQTMLYGILGLAAAVGGVLLAISGKRAYGRSRAYPQPRSRRPAPPRDANVGGRA